MDRTATANCDFPESAEWVSLVDAKDDVPTFNIQNVVSYFIERKVRTVNVTKITRISPAKLSVCFDMVTSKNWKSLGTTMTRYIFDVIAYLK